MIVDLCVWAKNGAEYLPAVLKRADDVIPIGCVNKKIFDDSSTDAKVEIAKILVESWCEKFHGYCYTKHILSYGMTRRNEQSSCFGEYGELMRC